jgi:hypothetical protein
MSGYNYSSKQTSTISTQTPQSLDSWLIVQILGDNAGIKLFMIGITLLMSLMFWYLRKEVRQLFFISISFYLLKQLKTFR